MTEPEIMLWSRLKGRGTDKPIFRRQFAYRSVIFDCYCPAARLAVEVDGATHWDEDKQKRTPRETPGWRGRKSSSCGSPRARCTAT